MALKVAVRVGRQGLVGGWRRVGRATNQDGVVRWHLRCAARERDVEGVSRRGQPTMLGRVCELSALDSWCGIGGAILEPRTNEQCGRCGDANDLGVTDGRTIRTGRTRRTIRTDDTPCRGKGAKVTRKKQPMD